MYFKEGSNRVFLSSCRFSNCAEVLPMVNDSVTADGVFTFTSTDQTFLVGLSKEPQEQKYLGITECGNLVIEKVGRFFVSLYLCRNTPFLTFYPTVCRLPVGYPCPPIHKPHGLAVCLCLSVPLHVHLSSCMLACMLACVPFFVWMSNVYAVLRTFCLFAIGCKHQICNIESKGETWKRWTARGAACVPWE